MNETPFQNTMNVMVVAVLFVTIALLLVDYLFVGGLLSWYTKVITIALLLGTVVLHRLSALSTKCRVFVILVLPILALEFHTIHSGVVGSLACSVLIVLTICSISRDTTLLLGIGFFTNILLIGNILFSSLLRVSPAVVVYNTIAFQVGLLVLYSLTRWSNEQMDAISRKTREAELAASAKSEFLANMNHEIRTPMNAVIGFTTFLQRQELSAESEEYVRGIRTASQALLSLINDTLDLSKIESGQYEIIPVTYELASLVNDTISTTCVRIENKPIRLLVRVDPNLPAYLIGDNVRIRQIMTNFLVNAIKYTDEGFVKLRVRGIASNHRILLYISIRDSGLGIREEDKVNLFQAFRKFDAHQNRAIEGTGLGLPLSRKLVDAMDGVVHVESVYGEGSTFTFMLPQDVPESVAPFVNVTIDPEIRVIVCESDHDEMEIWHQTLESLRVDHFLTTNFSEFVFLLQSNPEHRFFLDSDLYRRYNATLPTVTGALTVIAERNETFGSAAPFRVLRRPVYSLPLAAALGNVDIPVRTNNAEMECERFIVPSARILVVDDNAVNLTIFAGLLRPYQCDIELADGGREAVELLKMNFFDLVFMDHMMPEPDGVETAKIVRNLPGGRLLRRLDGSSKEYVQAGESYYQQIPIIVATANAISGMREEYLEGDFDDYITKPINASKLDSILQHWIPREKQMPFSSQETSKRDGRKNDFRHVLPGIDLPFLNVETGLRFTGDDFKGYIEVLKAFQARASTSREAVADFFKDGRWKDLTIEVHAVKSLAKGIGAERLSSLAAEMETAGKRQDRSSIAGHLEDFLKTFQLVENDIETVLKIFRSDANREEESIDVEIDTEELHRLLVAVASALDEFDFSESRHRFEQIPLKRLDKKVRERLEEIHERIERFEYEQASMEIRQYLNRSEHDA